MDSWLLLEKGPFRKVLVAPCSDTRGVSEVSAISFSSVGQPGKLTNAIKMDILRDVVVNSSNYDNIRDQPIYGCLGLIRIELGMHI